MGFGLLSIYLTLIIQKQIRLKPFQDKEAKKKKVPSILWSQFAFIIIYSLYNTTVTTHTHTHTNTQYKMYTN